MWLIDQPCGGAHTPLHWVQQLTLHGALKSRGGAHQKRLETSESLLKGILWQRQCLQIVYLFIFSFPPLPLSSVGHIWWSLFQHLGLAVGSSQQASKEQVLHREKQPTQGNIWRLLTTQRRIEVQKKAKQEGFVCSGAEEKWRRCGFFFMHRKRLRRRHTHRRGGKREDL